MNIFEAAKAAEAQKLPFITREEWRRIYTSIPVETPIKIQPTDTPACCILHGMGTSPAWQPMKADILADDWEPVRN